MRTKDGIPVPLILLGIRVAKARRWCLRALGLARRRMSIDAQMTLTRPEPVVVYVEVPTGPAPTPRGRPVTWYADSYDRGA